MSGFSFQAYSTHLRTRLSSADQYNVAVLNWLVNRAMHDQDYSTFLRLEDPTFIKQEYTGKLRAATPTPVVWMIAAWSDDLDLMRRSYLRTLLT